MITSFHIANAISVEVEYIEIQVGSTKYLIVFEYEHPLIQAIVCYLDPVTENFLAIDDEGDVVDNDELAVMQGFKGWIADRVVRTIAAHANATACGDYGV